MQNLSERLIKLMDESLTPFVGNLDEMVYLLNDANILYYLFPLIEKTVLEILKIYYFADVEKLSQGSYRTLNSLISQPRNRKFFQQDVLEKLDYFFNESGLRNILMHYSPKLDSVEININELEEVKELSVQLLEKLYKLIKNTKRISQEKVELIKLE